VTHFIEAIKKKLHNKLGHVDPDNITLHHTEATEALRPGLALNSVVSQPGFINNDESPLVVKAQTIVGSPTSPTRKPSRNGGILGIKFLS